MDEIVKQAMAKWPHVPHCYGWLGLDARGHWYLRDAATQAAGPFPHTPSANRGRLPYLPLQTQPLPFPVSSYAVRW